jgi:hypothetical protein
VLVPLSWPVRIHTAVNRKLSRPLVHPKPLHPFSQLQPQLSPPAPRTLSNNSNSNSPNTRGILLNNPVYPQIQTTRAKGTPFNISHNPLWDREPKYRLLWRYLHTSRTCLKIKRYNFCCVSKR